MHLMETTQRRMLANTLRNLSFDFCNPPSKGAWVLDLRAGRRYELFHDVPEKATAHRIQLAIRERV
jgi:hypothetical protein